MSDNEKRKLLIVTTISATVRAFLLPYADHFRQRGWQVDALCRGAADDPTLEGHFDSLFDAPWTRSPLSPSGASAMRIAARLVEENGYDIVHVHTPVASFLTRRACRALRLRDSARPKVVCTAHGFHFFRGGSRRRNAIYLLLERRAARWTDRLVTINREDYIAARRHSLLPPEKLVYMPGIGLDFTQYGRGSVKREDVLAIRTEMGLKDEDVLFTMLAEFNPGKRHRDVINALARLKDAQVHVAFAGDGPLRTKMQELAHSLAVHQRTHFLGFVKDTRPLVAASRATLMPSEREGLSRSAMESACLGVPIIGSDARGVRDVIEPHRGLLFPVGDVLALRDAMAQLAEEPYSAVKPDRQWRIEHLIELHDAMYEELLEEAAAHRSAVARREADRAERERLDAEQREIERKAAAARREQREAERARRAQEKEAERARRAEEKERIARERYEQRLAREQQKLRQKSDDIFDAPSSRELDREQMNADRFEWKPLFGDDEKKDRDGRS